MTLPCNELFQHRTFFFTNKKYPNKVNVAKEGKRCGHAKSKWVSVLRIVGHNPAVALKKPLEACWILRERHDARGPRCLATRTDVLEATDQVENVGVVTFSSSAALNKTLSSDYAILKAYVASINPSGNTAIGSGMSASNPELFNSVRARPFATKTIVVLTDGINNSGTNPVTVAGQLKAAHDVTIHVITLSAGVDITAMEQVAAIGGGKHYHSDDGSELTTIFREIANNLPTLLTK